MNNQLFEEVRNNNLLTVQQLVLNGADVNCCDDCGISPLHWVNSVEIAQFLVLNGADVNCRDNKGNTPLHSAKSVEIAQFLVLNGADVNCQNNDGDTPLHYINIVITKFLVINGANINYQNNINYLNNKHDRLVCICVSIHEYYNCIKNIKILLENGADMHIKNNKGTSAYDYVIRSNNNELIELFEQFNTISNGLDIKEPCVE